jgi:hypothetical protein
VRAGLLLLALVAGAAPAGAQTCRQALSRLTIPELSYAAVEAAPFGGSLYLYVPQIGSTYIRSRFSPFQLWVVEGVYGKPFARTTGSLDQAGFERLRKSANVRATPIAVSQPGPRPFTFGRQQYVIDLQKVNVPLSGADTVSLSVCR